VVFGFVRLARLEPEGGERTGDTGDVGVFNGSGFGDSA